MSIKRALTGGLISAIFTVYAMIFVRSLLTVALLEIRQANTVNFNSLVATLEERDRFNDKFTRKSLADISEQEDALGGLIKSENNCFEVSNASVPEVPSAGPKDQKSKLESCVV